MGVRIYRKPHVQLSGDRECGLRAGEVPTVETRARPSGREKERRG